jgi:transposase InsO family protein
MHHPRTAWPIPTRVSYVVAYEQLRKQHPTLSLRAFASKTEVPVATFARWWRQFQQRGPQALPDGSKRPRRSPTALPGSVLDTVRRGYREQGIGVRRLHATLTAAGTLTCSASSVYRILRRCGALVRRPRRPRPVWQRYAKEQPGERAQADLKYLPQGRFQLTLIDDCSRLLAATVLADRTQATVTAALARLLAQLPFLVQVLQTDNGSEFGQTCSAMLTAQGIQHVHIRPRTPRLNGKVERVQRTCAEEFWDGLDPDSPPRGWEAQLQGYVRRYNDQRLHSALGYRTPSQYATDRLAQTG